MRRGFLVDINSRVALQKALERSWLNLCVCVQDLNPSFRHRRILSCFPCRSGDSDFELSGTIYFFLRLDQTI